MGENLIGKQFTFEDDLWLVDSVTSDGETAFISQAGSVNSFVKMPVDQVELLLTPVVYNGPWPIVMDHYVQGEKWGLDEALEELGLSEEKRRPFGYIGLELKLTVELYEDGTHAITHVDDRKLPKPITG